MATTGPEQIAEKLLPLAEAIANLRPDPRNARKHGDKNLAAVRSSLTRFGQVKPIVVDADGSVLAGNGTLEAAKALGWKRLAVVRVPLTGADARAYALADNRTAELAEWDWEELASQMRELGAEAMLDIGWDDGDLSAMLSADLGAPLLPAVRAPQLTEGAPVEQQPRIGPPPVTAPEDDDTVDQLEAVTLNTPAPSSVLGGVYDLGPHRLVCGDSTQAHTIAIVMENTPLAKCVWTDPPYGVSYVGKTIDRLTVLNDDTPPEGLASLLTAAITNVMAHAHMGGAMYVAAPPGPPQRVFCDVLGDLGVTRQILAWVKHAMVLGHSDYHYKHESIFYGWKPGASHAFYGDRTHTTELRFDRPVRSTEHPTKKPTALIEYCLNNSTLVGDVVLDPFGGSGSTLVACAQLGRIARLVELSPHYCDVIRRRWTVWARANAVDPGPGALD